jgi:hypothetical protein
MVRIVWIMTISYENKDPGDANRMMGADMSDTSRLLTLPRAGRVYSRRSRAILVEGLADGSATPRR